MFRIYKNQVDAFAEMVLVPFIASAKEFLLGTVSERWAETSDADLHTWVDSHVRRALSMGLHDEDSVLRYLEVASVYGEEFAERGDVLNVLVDPDFLEDWDQALRIFDAHIEAK